MVPESIMPKYSFLGETPLNTDNAAAMLVALRRVGVPYSDRDVGEAMADMILQANPDSGGDVEDFQQRYPKAQVRDFDGDPSRLTEMDALVAYLQMLGTLVDVDSAAAQERLAEEKGR